jgi:hypothetical protein
VAHAQTQYVAMLPTSGKSARGLKIVAHAQTQGAHMLPTCGKSALYLQIMANAKTREYTKVTDIW